MSHIRYRRESDDPLIEVRFRGFGPVGWVVDISFDGAGVVFEPDDAPDVRTGDAVGLTLQAPGFAASLDALVVHSTRAQRMRRFGLQFPVADQVDRLAPILVALFHRRWSMRVLPDRAIPLTLTREDGTELRGMVRDLSARGVGALGTEGLKKGEVVTAAFALPTSGEPLDLVAVVRWVDGARVGLEVDRSRTRDLPRQQRAIVDYVLAFKAGPGVAPSRLGE